MSLGHGGARRGAGRRSADDDDSQSTAQQDYDEEKARHEKIKADEREFKLAVLQQEYLLKTDVQQAAATAMSVLTQSLRSIPDNLERVLSLAPEVVEQIAVQIDASLAEASSAFKAMSSDA